MLLAVMIKAVPDTASTPEIGNDGKSLTGRDTVKFVMNPYDEHALEEAVKLKETIGGEVIAICVGDDQVGPVIRAALAAGADRAILIRSENGNIFNPRIVAKAMADVLKDLSPDLTLAGRQAVDFDDAQVPEQTAEMMRVPHVSVVTNIQIEGRTLTVRQEMEGGHRKIDITLPALITIQKGINVPRYPTVPEVMKARRKPVEIKELLDLVSMVEINPGVEVDSLAAVQKKRLGKILNGDLNTQILELLSILNGTKISI